MKKFINNFAFAAVAVVLCAVSCNKEIEVEITAQNDVDLVEWTFEAQMPGTKTTIGDPQGGTADVSWEAGDEITLWYLNASNEPKSAVATAASAGTSTSFSAELPAGDQPDHFWAVYPKGAGELTYEAEAEKFSVTVAKTDGSFKAANIMAAYTTAEAGKLAFKNAVGIIKVALPAGGIISHNGKDMPISTIRIKGKETSFTNYTTVAVNQADGAVSGFEDAGTTGTKSANVELSDEVRASGVAYIPSLPGEFTNGFALRFYSQEGHIPAVLTKDKAITITRGHILPLNDFSSHIVWDYYVSPTGSGNGASAETAMSLADLQAMLTKAGNFMFAANQITGTTIHFAEGSYELSAPIVIPSFSETTILNFEGNGAVLDGNGACRILEINGVNKRVKFSDFTLQKGLHAAKGAAIFAAPGKSATDANFVIDFENCLIINNEVTSGYGAGLSIDATPAGQLRFNNCRFENNAVKAGQAGAVYLVPNCGAAALFNKCTFIGNTATTNTMTIGVNCNSAKDDNHGRLGMNNCTVNTGNKVFSSNGSALTLKGYSVIANSTIWGSGETGKWGTIALGANKAVQGHGANDAAIINCLVRNNSTTYKALYLHGSYYQNVKHSLYTGLTEAGSATATGDAPTYTLTNSAEINKAVGGASAKNVKVDGIQAYYYSFTQDFSGSITFPSLEQVKSDIQATNVVGPLLLDWLDGIEGALTTDITGYERKADASHPGSWQLR